MKTFLEILVTGILSYFLFTVITVFVRKLALETNLVDKPNHRKIHYKPVPIIGGITIGITALLLGALSNELLSKEFLTILLGGYILLIVGIIDDKTDMRALHKLLIQLCLGFMMAFSGIRISSLYGLFGIYEIHLYLQYFITILLITIAVNAFNFMDGIDGLAGSLALSGFSFLLVMAVLSSDMALATIVIIIIGSLIGFLKFNLSQKNKIFLGDSGSLFLGFLLINFGIYFIEKKSNTQFQNLGILYFLLAFLIPIFDFTKVFASRLLKKMSPFTADKTHLHHYLIQIGMSHAKSTLTIIMINLVVLAISYFILENSSINMLFISIVIIFSLYKFLYFVVEYNSWKNDIKKLEFNDL